MAINMGMGMGLLITGRELVSSVFNRVDKKLTGLAKTSTVVAEAYDRNMMRMKKGALALGVAVVGLAAMTGAAKHAGRFAYTMAAVGQVTGATAGEMDQLTASAIQAGIATQFSPREAAEGLQALGAAGMNASQAMVVLNPVLDLAAGSLGQLGVAGAAENVVGVLNAFSMQARDAAMVTDQLVRITQISNFQARDFAVAISQASSQAASANQTFESMIATLGMLRNANMHASVAATAYREAVRRLSSDKEVHKRLSKLGIEVLDKETNKIKDLGMVIAQLAPQLEGMNAKEKNVALQRIFGVRGMKTYSSFLSQYHKLVKEGKVATGDYAAAHRRLVSELDNASGAAAKNRDALLKTAEGQRILLKGSWETTQIMLGQLAIPAVLPALRSLTDTLNIFIQILNSIPAPVREMMSYLAGAALAFKAISGSIMLLRGLGGMLTLVRMAGAMKDLGSEAKDAAPKVGLLRREFAKGHTGMTRFFTGARQVLSMWAGAAGIVIPVVMGISAYMQAKYKEEQDRVVAIRRQNVAMERSYFKAWHMAKSLRAETAKLVADWVREGSKTMKGAEMALTKTRAKWVQSIKAVKDNFLALAQATGRHGRASKEANAARATYIKSLGVAQAAIRGLTVAEGNQARFAIKNAKTVADKQVLGRKIVAARMLKEDEMRAASSKKLAEMRARMEHLTGADKKYAQRRYDYEKRLTKMGQRRFSAETARIALRARLADRDILKRKERGKKLRAIAAPVLKAPLLPTEKLMDLGGGVWRRAAEKGELPAGLTPDLAEKFAAFREYYRAERGAAGKVLPEGPAAKPTAAAAPTAPLPPVPTFGQGATGGIYGWEKDVSVSYGGGASFFDRLNKWIDAANRSQEVAKRPVVAQLIVDKEKLAEMVIGFGDDQEQENEGDSGVSGAAGVQGAG